MTACPDKALLLNALLDGELDASNALAFEEHLKICAGCAAELEGLRAQREQIAAPGVRYTAPDALHARIRAALDAEARPRATAQPRLSALRSRLVHLVGPWGLSGAATALAASFAFMLFVRPPVTDVTNELVASHVRSMQVDHLTDVATSDRHVVKPWFNGKADFSPPVVELADDGFPLVGGRLDYVGGRIVTAVVYRRREHVINVFVWPLAGGKGAAEGSTRREGYNVLRWARDGLQFSAVSDVDGAELATFRAAFEQRAR